MFTDIADGNGNYRYFFANVDTIHFRLSLAHTFYVDTLNDAKNQFGNTFCRKKRALTQINVVSHDFHHVRTSGARILIVGESKKTGWAS